MRTLYVTIALLTLGLGTQARADWPYPFNAEPSVEERLWCSRDYVQSVESELRVMEKLHAAGPTAVGRLCKLVAMGSAWLSEDVRSELSSLLGVDVDPDRIRSQCRSSRDNLEQTLTTRIRRLRSELVRCDDTV